MGFFPTHGCYSINTLISTALYNIKDFEQVYRCRRKCYIHSFIEHTMHIFPRNNYNFLIFSHMNMHGSVHRVLGMNSFLQLTNITNSVFAISRQRFIYCCKCAKAVCMIYGNSFAAKITFIIHLLRKYMYAYLYTPFTIHSVIDSIPCVSEFYPIKTHTRKETRK